MSISGVVVGSGEGNVEWVAEEVWVVRFRRRETKRLT